MKKRISNCEDCVHYDYNEETETYECNEDLDEYEIVRFIKGDNGNCPYYRYYDEYKLVRKQN